MKEEQLTVVLSYLKAKKEEIINEIGKSIDIGDIGGGGLVRDLIYKRNILDWLISECKRESGYKI
jgi:hypothetical protein